MIPPDDILLSAYRTGALKAEPKQIKAFLRDLLMMDLQIDRAEEVRRLCSGKCKRLIHRPYD
jgi:hypothetical protein